MKTTAATIILFAAQVFAFAQGVFIGPGQHFDFEVSSLAYVGPSDPSDICTLLLNFQNNLLDPGETISLVVSQTPITDPAAAGTSFTQPLAQPSLGGFALMQSNPFWPNLPGYLRVQMQSGSVEVSRISVEQIVNGGFYSSTFAVPEPSACALTEFGLAVLGTLVGARRRSPKNRGRHQPPS